MPENVHERSSIRGYLRSNRTRSVEGGFSPSGIDALHQSKYADGKSEKPGDQGKQQNRNQ